MPVGESRPPDGRVSRLSVRLIQASGCDRGLRATSGTETPTSGNPPTNGRTGPTGDLPSTRLGALILVVNHLHRVMTMTAHKPEKEDVVRHEEILIGTGPDDMRILRMKLGNPDELSILDDDLGGDPYNSTGQYAVLKDKQR